MRRTEPDESGAQVNREHDAPATEQTSQATAPAMRDPAGVMPGQAKGATDLRRLRRKTVSNSLRERQVLASGFGASGLPGFAPSGCA